MCYDIQEWSPINLIFKSQNLQIDSKKMAYIGKEGVQMQMLAVMTLPQILDTIVNHLEMGVFIYSLENS